MNYRRINNLTGWAVAAIAYTVYLMTMEPTASFWDCGEFLACASKLEVGHSPGAPFFMLLQRLFGIFAPSPAKMAIVINSLSALTSALTILFLFWTITHYARKLLSKDGPLSNNHVWLIMGAGVVGALAYTFSDTFWFSAVEAEVYATSSFFTAITFWAILKWEEVADTKYADRWLILIAYLIGVSVGVHLLNLLCIPPIIMTWYFRRYNASIKGTIIAFFAGCAILAFVQFGVIQYIPKFAAGFDIFFTNNLGMPFDIGSIVFLMLLAALLIFLLLWAKRKQYYLLHTGILCIMFIVIGYSSYVVPLIRSRANPAVDMTNPDNAMSLKNYVSREQFGQQPLFTGPDFNSPMVSVEKTGTKYAQLKVNGKDHYEDVGDEVAPVFDPSSTRFFPRIWESGEGHPQFYKSYLGLAEGEQPTASDNMKFFFGYQMNWMWWRYFMWNYAGRQNDFEGQGEPKNGNWISGIPFLDQMHIGNINKMPEGYRNNAARNQLYFLPFILGLLGMVYQFNRNKKDGLVVLLFFFFTGAAICIYLNMPPVQPRERDYAFAGCTYVFAIWIGLGVLMVQQALQKIVNGRLAVGGSVALCLLAVPVLMASQEWDDHDRSKKTLARDSAYNVLQSCAPNAVLLTFGDNDTYPLWYLQEVEGIRRDVRIMIVTLVGTDWFLDQLQYKVNDADAVPMVWHREDYLGTRHDYVRYYNDPKVPQDKYVDLYDVCQFIISKDPNNMLHSTTGEAENYLPTTNFYVHGISKEDLVKNGMLNPADSSKIINEMKFSPGKNAMYKNDLAILNIIAAIAKEGWKRPLYLSGAFPNNEGYLGLTKYLRQEGLVYRVVPYSMQQAEGSKGDDVSDIDLDKSYQLFTNTYKWGGANRNDVYFDEKNRIMFTAYKLYAARIAEAFVKQGRNREAVQLLDHVNTSITQHSFPDPITNYYMAEAYYHAGAVKQASAIAHEIAKYSEDDIAWINSLDESGKEAQVRDARTDLTILNILGNTAEQATDHATAAMLSQKLKTLYASIGPLVDQKNI
ncbi:MAG: glycosyltransferase family 117 protein [Flavipsychrobacter sp.]